MASSSRSHFSEAYDESLRDFALDKLAIDTDEVFAGARDETRGRGVKL